LHLFNIETRQDSIVGPLDGQRIIPLADSLKQVRALISTQLFRKPGFEIHRIENDALIKKAFTSSNGKYKAPPLTYTYGAYAETDSLIWLATEEGLLAFFPRNNDARFYNSFNDLPVGVVWAVTKLNQNYLIVTSSQGGVLLFDVKAKAFTQQFSHAPEEEYGLKLKVINDVYVDSQENIWLSSPRDGLAFGNLVKRKMASVLPLKGKAVKAVYESSSNAVWCNGAKGEVYRFNNSGEDYDKYLLYSKDPQVPSGVISCFFEDNTGTLWGCYGKYLFRWNAAKNRFDHSGKLPATYLAYYKLASGKSLVATYGGIYWVNEYEKGLSFSPAEELGEFQVQLTTAIYEDKLGRIYLALDASRLVILEKKGAQYQLIRSIGQIGYAKSFHETENTLWVATSNGLLKVDLDHLSSQMLNEANDGIPQEFYYAVVPAEDGNLWLSCNQGIIQYNPKGKSFWRYTLADGIQGLEYNTNAFLGSSSGHIWMGGNNGLNLFDPLKIQKVPNLPAVQFTNLLINDEAFFTKIQIGELESLILPFKKNTISLTALALEYSDPARNAIRYRLENYDDEWVNAKENGFIRYPNLPPGSYRLQVVAANSDGVWSEAIRQLNISIKTPWWRSWWFYLSCLLGITTLVYSAFHYRLQQALKIERMRVKISSDLHDDVGSILTGLAMQSEVMEITASNDKRPQLAQISKMSRDALSRMRDTVWAIDGRKDKVENLLDRMLEHAEETLTPRRISFAIINKQIAPSTNLPSHIRQNLYLIFKEATTNAAKHSTGNKLVVELKKWKQGLEMIIHDNGVVKIKTYKTTGLGMDSMRARASQINAQFKVDSSDGFQIKLQLPKIN